MFAKMLFMLIEDFIMLIYQFLILSRNAFLTLPIFNSLCYAHLSKIK